MKLSMEKIVILFLSPMLGMIQMLAIYHGWCTKPTQNIWSISTRTFWHMVLLQRHYSVCIPSTKRMGRIYIREDSSAYISRILQIRESQAKFSFLCFNFSFIFSVNILKINTIWSHRDKTLVLIKNKIVVS
jgi:hypothetical protein